MRGKNLSQVIGIIIMLYLIKDETKNMLGQTKCKVIKVCLNENEVMSYLSKKENLKQFNGDIKVERVVL